MFSALFAQLFDSKPFFPCSQSHFLYHVLFSLFFFLAASASASLEAPGALLRRRAPKGKQGALRPAEQPNPDQPSPATGPDNPETEGVDKPTHKATQSANTA